MRELILQRLADIEKDMGTFGPLEREGEYSLVQCAALSDEELLNYFLTFVGFNG